MAESLPKKSKATLVIGDFHLGEGRRLWDGTINELEDFTADERFAEFLEYYQKLYDEIELVLNGNFFEMLGCRVLRDYPDILFETYAVELIEVQLRAHPLVISALRKFLENENNRLVYLLGEADAGITWPAVQQKLKEAISERIDFRFNEYQVDGIHIQHGHQFDAMFQWDESDRFREMDGVRVLKLPWGAFFYAHFVLPLRKIRPQFYRARPMKAYLLWTFFFETRFFLQVVLQFIKMLWRASSQRLYPGNSLLDIYKIFSQAADPQQLENYAEMILDSDKIQKVIFGHSHIADYRQFRNGKEYFNTGTWRKNLSLDMRSLGSYQKLSYVLVEYREELQARLMEWRGRHRAVEDFY